MHRLGDRFFLENIDFGPMKSQCHHSRINVSVLCFVVFEESIFDELEASFTFDCQVSGNQGIQASSGVWIVALDHRLEQIGILGQAANAQHRVIQSLSVR